MDKNENIYRSIKNDRQKGFESNAESLSRNVRISVIIPLLNEEKLIKRVLSQFTDDFKKKHNVEVILSDGGSTDDTLKIINSFYDKLIIPESGKKQNIASGRNLGAKYAEGEILVFFNADTYSNNLDLMFNRLKNIINNDGVVAIAYPIKVFREESKLSDRIFHSIYNLYVRFLNFLRIGMARGECQVICKKAFEKVNGYNENLVAGEDFDMYRRLSKIGKIYFSKEDLIYESPRRYRKYGYLKLFFLWAINALWILLFNKSFSKKWEPVR
ncbi:MAG: glycosyltransferase [Ignavibacteria bacterium]|nr:glycosyltransferase [Ignavibacteria bacterium]